MNPAIVYDGSIRDSGTPLYFRLALAQILGRDPDWFTEDPSAGAIEAKNDFYIHIDDGRDDLPADGIPHPWGYYATDSHLGPEIRILKAKQADLVWCAQLPFVKVLKEHGVDAKWVPLACMPEVHFTAQEDPESRWPLPDKDLVFVGHIQDPSQTDRLAFLDHLFREFPDSWYAYGHFHEEMSRVYHRGRIGVNHAVRDDLNMRFFEIASMGVPQYADEGMVGLKELGFEPWVDYIPQDKDHDNLRMMLDSPERRTAIAGCALAKVRAAHTYRHRLGTMLADVEQFLSTR